MKAWVALMRRLNWKQRVASVYLILVLLIGVVIGFILGPIVEGFEIGHEKVVECFRGLK